MSARYEHLGRGDALNDASDAPDREISLGTATVLAIFVGLAVLCGVFFGFGYSMGRKSMLPSLGNVDTHVSAPTAASTIAAEPDSSVSDPTPPTTVIRQSARRTGADTASEEEPAPLRPAPSTKPSAASSLPLGSARSGPVHPERTGEESSSLAQRPAATPKTSAASGASQAAASAPTTASSSSSAPASGAQSYVQVAAISHREDADLLLASLHRRGYSASIRQVPQDNLLHIQIGPLAGKKDAELMRQRLLSDGYNAIVK